GWESRFCQSAPSGRRLPGRPEQQVSSGKETIEINVPTFARVIDTNHKPVRDGRGENRKALQTVLGSTATNGQRPERSLTCDLQIRLPEPLTRIRSSSGF